LKTRITLALLASCLAVSSLVACGGKSRTPVLTGTPGGAGAGRTDSSGSGTGAGGAGQSIDSGPDIQPVDNDGATGQDYAVSDPSGEGGPLADVHFDYDRATLTDEARAVLEKHALWLQNHRDAKVMVEGHCDERGTTEYNLALGEQRARAVAEYLAGLGVAESRLRTTSYGKERPLDPASTEAAWATNRRAHFAVSR
jgi:peptidoglycan-associated lipoprotein